jgi:threonylcarbamoyladenosine tRNA methylthiotransferase MtaB
MPPPRAGIDPVEHLIIASGNALSTDPNRTFPNRAPAYFVASLGCKVSRIDAVARATPFDGAGYTRAEEPADADVLVVQSCTVTERADRDVKKLVRRLARESPLAALVVTGCLAERDAGLLAAMPEVSLVLARGVTTPIDELLRRREAGDLPSKVVRDEGPPTDSPLSVALEPDRTRAFVKLQDGCGRRCAFCIVPSVRGPERSAAVADVLRTVRELGEAGVPEVVLSGVHLASFGSERGESLLALLDALEKEPPRCRVRFSSLEPMEAGLSLVTRIAGSAVVVPHLHLPLQSGSARVLRRMRRGILPERYAALARAAFATNPRVHLATDVIAGFPGETDEDFDETVRLLEELPFASIHVFPFSPRSGTRAAELQETEGVPRAVVAGRARALRALAAEKSAAFEARNAGTLADVVVLAGGRALTDNYLELPLVPPDAAPRGARLTVRLAGPPAVLDCADAHERGEHLARFGLQLSAIPIESPARNPR